MPYSTGRGEVPVERNAKTFRGSFLIIHGVIVLLPAKARTRVGPAFVTVDKGEWFDLLGGKGIYQEIQWKTQYDDGTRIERIGVFLKHGERMIWPDILGTYNAVLLVYFLSFNFTKSIMNEIVDNTGKRTVRVSGTIRPTDLDQLRKVVYL
jgi:hypothetical protein